MKLRHWLATLPILLGSITAAHAQISIGIGTPNISIGINMPTYPRLIPVPGYPVYYDPYVDANYFFYDGLYWVYQGDHWYASSWYNGPWQLVDPNSVPLFVLRIPVRYYRRPPPYFREWRADAPPHWGEHWGSEWQQRHNGWDRWDHRAALRPAPLPNYQRQYSQEHYPHTREQQQTIRSEHYRYQPQEAVTRQHFERGQRAPSMPHSQNEQRPQQMERRNEDRSDQRERGGENRGEERGRDRH